MAHNMVMFVPPPPLIAIALNNNDDDDGDDNNNNNNNNDGDKNETMKEWWASKSPAKRQAIRNFVIGIAGTCYAAAYLAGLHGIILVLGAVVIWINWRKLESDHD